MRTFKNILNADSRRSSATRISGSAKIFGGNADERRYYSFICDNLKCNLRLSALKSIFRLFNEKDRFII